MEKLRTTASWVVHALTSSSAILGLWSAYQATQQKMHLAFLLLIATILVDSIDGPIARAVNVKKHTREFDGGLLDNIIDFFTWSIVPCFFLIIHPLFSFNITFILSSGIILGSCYQFCCLDAKIDGQYFKRFPSVWSPTIICIYLVTWPESIKIFVIGSCIFLSFVPMFVPKPFYNPIIHIKPFWNTLGNHLNNLENILLVSACLIGAMLYPLQPAWITILFSVCIIIRLIIWITTTYTIYRHQLQT